MTVQIRKSQNIKLTEVKSDAFLPTESGNFRVSVTPDADGMEHALLYVDGFEEAVNPLIRIHSECLTGDAFGSLKCDCGAQLNEALEQMGNEKSGWQLEASIQSGYQILERQPLATLLFMILTYPGCQKINF